MVCGLPSGSAMVLLPDTEKRNMLSLTGSRSSEVLVVKRPFRWLGKHPDLLALSCSRSDGGDSWA